MHRLNAGRVLVAFRRIEPLCLAVLAACFVTPAATAQNLPLKRTALEPATVTCPAPPVSALRPSARPEVTDSLLTAGSRAAILGDHETARDLFREAATLDPANAVVAYRLARTLDERGEIYAAILEYCRYLSLAPAAPDTGQVRERLQTLATSEGSPFAPPGKAEMEAAIAAYEQGRYDEAALAFGSVIALRPGEAEPVYNRAIAHLAAGRQAEAIADLQTYLRLAPTAEDRLAVAAVLEQMGAQAAPPQVTAQQPFEPRWNAGGVLVSGLVVPGMAQITTGRPFWGLLVLAGVGGAAYYATLEEEVTRTVQYLDPFGNPYEGQITTVERPNRTVGIGAAVALGVAAAVEGFLYARRTPRLAVDSADASYPQAAGPPVRLQLTHDKGQIRIGFRIQSGE